MSGAYAVSPEGTVTHYPSANWMKWDEDGSVRLYDGDPKKPNARFLARIPATHIVSFEKPGVEFKGPPGNLTVEAALDIVSRCIRTIRPTSRYSFSFERIKALKRELQDFDARGEGWK